MMLATAALAAALLPGASALPKVQTGNAMVDYAAELAEAYKTDADGNHHLYFYATDAPVPSFLRCGEVDAAPFMPASLFEPANALSLAAYVEATLKLYVNPNPLADGPLKLGRCSSIGYTVSGGGVQGISWFGRGGLMSTVCADRCQCSFLGSGPAGLPDCTDQPDQPEAGRFCSLCGPTTACPGCTANTVVISLFYPPSSTGEKVVRRSLPEAEESPFGSTKKDQEAAHQALAEDGGVAVGVSDAVRSSVAELAGALSSTAVSTDAYGTKHLWFRATDDVIAWKRCGDIDAAPYMPAAMFEPQHALALAAYIEATLRLYVNPNALADPLELGRCEDIGATISSGGVQGIRWFGDFGTNPVRGLMGPVCAERCGCNFEFQGPDNLPLCTDVPDEPDAGRFCSLCGPTTACRGCNFDTVIVNMWRFPSDAAEEGHVAPLAIDERH